METESQGPIKYAVISANASADIVAAVSGKKIRVLSLFLTITTDNGTVKFQSGGSTDITGAMSFLDGIPLSLGFNPAGWFETTAGAKLNMVLSNAGQTSGALTYQELA